jgi:Tol biopolymer transport system component
MCLERAALLSTIGLASLVTAAGGASAPTRTTAAGVVRNGLIAFGSNRTTPRNEEIYVMNPDGSGERRLTNAPGHDSGPVWSPDGRKLAFLRFPQGEGPHPGDIVVVNVDGSGEHRVTRLSGAAPDPAWSPDGRTIAYAGNYGIYLINVDGTACGG